MACSNNFLKKMGNDDMLEVTNTKNETSKCLQNCEHQNLIPTFTTSIFPIEQTFMQNPFFCLTLFKLAKICMDPHKAHIFEDGRDQTGIKCQDILKANNTIPLCSSDGQPKITEIKANAEVSDFAIKYASKNLALLKVFIKDPYYTLIKRDEESKIFAFLGNVGGTLGLCMGLNLVNIFELIYHLLNYLIVRFLNKPYN